MGIIRLKNNIYFKVITFIKKYNYMKYDRIDSGLFVKNRKNFRLTDYFINDNPTINFHVLLNKL